MADFVNKKELYDYIQKENAWEQSKTRLPRYERELYVPDACYEMLDKINEFNAKQLECTVPKVYISTDLQATVDIVRHAHWEQPSYFDEENGVFRCSNCKEEFVLISGSPKENGYEYCPHCGAKMDEVEK